MRILVLNAGNLADVVQSLPAFSDAVEALPHLVIDVVVDERWEEVPHWHKAVGRVFTIPMHRWRHGLLSMLASDDAKKLRRQLRKFNYDWVIDLHGSWISAGYARSFNSASAGFSRVDRKKRTCSYLYHYRHPEESDLHRVNRIRNLFSHSLGYAVRRTPPDYGLDIRRFVAIASERQRVCLLLGAKQPQIRMPGAQATALIQQLQAQGYEVRLAWRDRNSGDYLKAIAAATGAVLLPNLKLSGIASVMADSMAVIAVDNGLSNLAAAFGVPLLRLAHTDADNNRTAFGGCQRVVPFATEPEDVSDWLVALQQLLSPTGLPNTPNHRSEPGDRFAASPI
ncbi:glycosyltransferase family 9 protein [Halioxenophilus sp. WMMB6]|uniref:glycosyltransferase family 9 protein n=1 Tax=Halioxenophilus sp. WMMB6 TaxID=3073815 RepID=UPI00295E7B71|nr:glycosyltransferase family 9 protein [Halioxenophilus sp. WMMB6]